MTARSKKKSKTRKKSPTVSRRERGSTLLDAQVVTMVSRPLYWDTIHEAVAIGDLNEMRRLSVIARKLLGDVEAAVRALDDAMGKLER